MHPNEGELRAYLDNEIGGQPRQQIQEHLAGCAECNQRLSLMAASAGRVSSQLRALQPGEGRNLSANRALAKFVDRRKESRMKTFYKRPAFVGIALAVILVVAMMFPSVQALASSFLGLFRVEQVRVVSFDPANLEKYEGTINGSQSMIDQYFKDNMVETTQGTFQQVNTADEAAAITGYNPALPRNIQITSLGVSPAQHVEINIDTSLVNPLIEALGHPEAQLPEAVNGKKVVVEVPASVTAGIGNCPDRSGLSKETAPDLTSASDCVYLMEVPSPTVSAPDELDVNLLGETFLQILGMSPEDARSFAATTDWSTTLILPVPTGQGVKTESVHIGRINGTLVTEENSSRYTLIWVSSGMIYSLSGTGPSDTALQLAQNIR